MAHNKGMKVTFEAIEQAIQAMENGTLDSNGLDLLVANSRELYEKLLILQYKAYEKQVFGDTTPVVQDTQVESKVNPVQEIAVETVDEPIEAIGFNMAEVEHTEDLPVVELVSQPTFDFSFNEAVPTEPSENPAREELHESRLDQLNLHAHVESKTESPVVAEDESIQEMPSHQNASETLTIEHALVAKYAKIEDTFFKRIGHTKIQSLQQSFPLNDRLLFNRELFSGAGDVFSQAVNELDAAHSYTDALQIASRYADRFDWKIESPAVNGFIDMIKRRHG
jgi:hypothetical protein